jgi:hypothetical protein
MAFETHITLPVGRFGASRLHVRYHPSTHGGFYVQPDPPEIEILAAESEGGMPFDIHLELDEDTLGEVYETALNIADDCWCDNYNRCMSPEQGQEWA